MGRQITRTAENRYIIESTVSDGVLHEENTLSVEEAKAFFIQEELDKFMVKAIEIDMTFPAGYTVNKKRELYNSDFHDWYSHVLRQDNADELIKQRFQEIGITF